MQLPVFFLPFSQTYCALQTQLKVLWEEIDLSGISCVLRGRQVSCSEELQGLKCPVSPAIYLVGMTRWNLFVPLFITEWYKIDLIPYTLSFSTSATHPRPCASTGICGCRMSRIRELICLQTDLATQEVVASDRAVDHWNTFLAAELCASQLQPLILCLRYAFSSLQVTYFSLQIHSILYRCDLPQSDLCLGHFTPLHLSQIATASNQLSTATAISGNS